MSATPMVGDSIDVRRIGSLPLRARVIVDSVLSGLHRARHHGSSIEFAEHKVYSPGDEIRHIDWRALAKHDRYYVKRFEQEAQLDVYLLIDTSASMGFASGAISKLWFAAELAAALAVLAVHHQDRVALLPFGNPTADWIPLGGKPSHLRDALALLEAELGRGGTGAQSPERAFDRVVELSRRRRGLVVLLSDLFDATGSVVPGVRRLRGRGHDVAVLHTLDRAELEFPYEGMTQFEDLESGRRLLTQPAAIRAQYLRQMEQFVSDIRNATAAAGATYQQCPTDAPPEQTLVAFLTAAGTSRRSRRSGPSVAGTT